MGPKPGPGRRGWTLDRLRDECGGEWTSYAQLQGLILSPQEA